MDTHTHTHTYKGNDNTYLAKMRSRYIYKLETSSIANSIQSHIGDEI